MSDLTFEELDNFTFATYIKLLSNLKKSYKIVPFCRIPKEQVRYLILRHDVDFSLSNALVTAKIERDLGIKATYFVLLSTESYNLLKKSDARILQEISSLGHEIGLHYYPEGYRLATGRPVDTFETEIKQLERLTKKKIYSIARHGPWDRDPFASTKKYINANHPFYRSDLFVHDSCRAWTPFEGLIRLLKDPPRRAQLLVHSDNLTVEKASRRALLAKLTYWQTGDDIESVKKIWLTDPSVLRYDNQLKDEHSVSQFESNCTHFEKPRIRPLSGLQYYERIARWHLVNSSTGWRLHKIIGGIKFRDKK